MSQQKTITSSTGRTTSAPERWLAQLVPSAREQRTLDALATGMSGLAVRKQSVALEITALATEVGVRRSFLVRTQTREGRTQICSQLQAQYPQATIRFLTDEEDPLQLGAHEEATCVELRLGAPTYLPIRTWQRKALDEEGTDPLLNILAAMKSVPPKHRAIVQLVLASAPDTWSRKAQRLAQSRPIEEEHFQSQSQTRSRPRNTVAIENELFLEGVGGLLLISVLLYWLWTPLHAIIPPWMWHMGSSLVHGRPVHLSGWEIAQLCLGGIVLLTALAAIGWLFTMLKNWWGSSWSSAKIYDPELVRQKTERIAYRAKIRLYVIGPRPHQSGIRATAVSRFASGTAEPLKVGHFSWWKQRVGELRDSIKDIRPWARLFWRIVWVRTSAWWKALPSRSIQRIRQGRAWIRASWLFFHKQRKAAKDRQHIIGGLIAAFRVYHLASGNYFVPRRIPRWLTHWRLSVAVPSRALGGLRRQAAFLTPEEVASLYHLLQDADLRDMSFLERVGMRTLPVPVSLARGEGEPFAINSHAGECKAVFFPKDILRYNLLALAGTGKGKSSLFTHLACMLFADPIKRAAVLVDPHGDLALSFLSSVPQARRDEVVYLNLADKANPPGLNFVDMSSGQDRDKVVDTNLTVFHKWWGEHWGPRIENTMQYCMLTLCEVNRSRCLADQHNGPRQQCTLLSIFPLLVQPKYRDTLLKEVRDPDIKNWWNGYYNIQPDQKEIAASVITKISKFRASKVVRRIVGQPVSSISLADIVTNGHILIVNTASGIVGEDTSTLCGSLLLGLLHTCIAEQAERQAAVRMPVYVFVDEIQKFTGVNLNAMMAEMRKYGGSFALATQSFAYLDVLDPTLRSTILANTDQLFAYDMAAEDAESMAKEIGDGIEADDILSLDNYACYAKLTIAGARVPAFSLKLLPPPTGDAELAKTIQEKSARTYGRPSEDIDKQLLRQDRNAPTRTPGQATAATPSTPDSPDQPDDDDGLSPNFDSIDQAAQAREIELPAY